MWAEPGCARYSGCVTGDVGSPPATPFIPKPCRLPGCGGTEESVPLLPRGAAVLDEELSDWSCSQLDRTWCADGVSGEGDVEGRLVSQR